MKQRIRLTESDLHRMIKESVKQVLKENIPYFDVESYEYHSPNLSDDEWKEILDGEWASIKGEDMFETDYKLQQIVSTGKWDDKIKSFIKYCEQFHYWMAASAAYDRLLIVSRDAANNKLNWDNWSRHYAMKRNMAGVDKWSLGNPNVRNLPDPLNRQDWSYIHDDYEKLAKDRKNQAAMRAMRNAQERDKYEKMADYRPLHRKGSVNREL